MILKDRLRAVRNIEHRTSDIGPFIRREDCQEYEAAAMEDGERKRKTGTRRTVDYGCTNVKWLTERLCRRSEYDEIIPRPELNAVIDVYPLLHVSNDSYFQLVHTEIIHLLPSRRNMSIPPQTRLSIL